MLLFWLWERSTIVYLCPFGIPIPVQQSVLSETGVSCRSHLCLLFTSRPGLNLRSSHPLQSISGFPTSTFASIFLAPLERMMAKGPLLGPLFAILWLPRMCCCPVILCINSEQSPHPIFLSYQGAICLLYAFAGSHRVFVDISPLHLLSRDISLLLCNQGTIPIFCALWQLLGPVNIDFLLQCPTPPEPVFIIKSLAWMAFLLGILPLTMSHSVGGVSCILYLPPCHLQ